LGEISLCWCGWGCSKQNYEVEFFS